MADPPRPLTGPGVPAEPPKDEALTGEIIDALDALPEKQRTALTTVLVSQEVHIGPLPSPKMLAGYAAILPSAPREIMDMANKEQAHQIAYRDRELNSEIAYRLFTLAAAFTVIIVMVIGAIILGVTGHEALGAGLGAASGLTLIAGAFLRGRDLFPKAEQIAAAQPPAVQERAAGQPQASHQGQRQSRPGSRARR